MQAFDTTSFGIIAVLLDARIVNVFFSCNLSVFAS